MKKIIYLPILAISFAVAAGAFADTTKNSQAEECMTLKECRQIIADLKMRLRSSNESSAKSPPPCSSIDPRTAAVGTRCRTKKEAIFERVARKRFGEAWRGPDDLVWSDFVGMYPRLEADASCNSIGAHLPDHHAFVRGEANGFREVLPSMEDRKFWTFSDHPNYPNSALTFDGSEGKFGSAEYDDEKWVRCVGD